MARSHPRRRLDEIASKRGRSRRWAPAGAALGAAARPGRGRSAGPGPPRLPAPTGQGHRAARSPGTSPPRFPGALRHLLTAGGREPAPPARPPRPPAPGSGSGGSPGPGGGGSGERCGPGRVLAGCPAPVPGLPPSTGTGASPGRARAARGGPASAPRTATDGPAPLPGRAPRRAGAKAALAFRGRGRPEPGRRGLPSRPAAAGSGGERRRTG